MTLSTHRKHLFSALELIPSHRDPPKTEQTLIAELAAKLSLPAAECTGIISAAIGILDTMGMMRSDADGLRLNGQLPQYFVRSLGWFAKHGLPALDGWRQDVAPLSKVLPRGDYFDHAAHVLAAIEARRIRLAIKHGLNAEASRDQSAVVVMIGDGDAQQPRYLHQFDTRADQYQLIGGRIEIGETILMAAKREVVEELGPAAENVLVPDRDFSLKLMYDGKPALVTVETSHTYGALTRYTFYGCTAEWRVPIRLGPKDRWIPLDEALTGRTHDGVRVGNIRLLERLADAVRS